MKQKMAVLLLYAENDVKYAISERFLQKLTFL